MKARFILMTTLATSLLLTQCAKEEEAAGLDKELFDEANGASVFTYYKNNTDILASSQPSAHEPFMRVRFNAIAQSALDSTGKLPAGSSFRNGSLIVKELYGSQTGPVVLYAIMKKDSSDSNAGANWLWAEIKPDRNVAVSVTKKGASCTSCHSINSRDYSRVFDLF